MFRGFIYWKYQDRIIQKALKISRTFKISFHISTISMVKSDVGAFFIVSKYMNMFLLNIMLLISNTHNKVWRKKSFKITITAEQNEHYHLRQSPKMNDMATPSYRETNKKFYMLLGRNMIFLPYQTENKRRNNLVVPLQVNI